MSMTPDQIEQMARNTLVNAVYAFNKEYADWLVSAQGDGPTSDGAACAEAARLLTDSIDRFAQAVRAAALEEAAKSFSEEGFRKAFDPGGPVDPPKWWGCAQLAASHVQQKLRALVQQAENNERTLPTTNQGTPT